MVERAFAAVLQSASLLCLIALLLMVCAQVLARLFPVVSVSWMDEVIELSFAWMVFLGTVVLWRDGDLITIDFLPKALSGRRVGLLLDIVLYALKLVFLSVFTWQGAYLTAQTTRTSTSMLDLPKAIWYGVIPFSGFVMLAYTSYQAVRAIREFFSGPHEAAAATPSETLIGKGGGGSF